jgi:putative methionine-R-sulfoxide reductase with GAF domain
MSVIKRLFSREKSKAQAGDHAQTIYRLSVVTAVVSFALILNYLPVTIKQGDLISILGQSPTLILSLLAVFMSRKGKSTLSVWLMLVGIATTMPIAALLTQGMGLFLGGVAAIWGTIICMIGLRDRQTRWGLFYTNGFASLTWLLDLLGSPERPQVDLPLITVVSTFLGILVIYLLSFPRLLPDLSLQAKLIAGFAAAAVLTAVGVGAITSQNLQTTMTAQLGGNFATSAESLAELVNSFYIGKVSQIVALAESDIVKEQVRTRNASYSGSEADILAEIQALDNQWLTASDYDPLVRNIITPNKDINPGAYQTKEYLETFPDQTEIFFTDRYGATVAATGRLSDYYQADEGWWEAAWNDGEGAVYISDPEYDESAGVTAVLIAVPIREERTGEIIGVVRSTLNMEELEKLIMSVRIGETGHAVLLGRTGNIIFESADAETSMSRAPEIIMRILQQYISSTEETRYMTGFDVDGNESLFGYAPISHGAGEKTNATEIAIEEAINDLGWTAVIRQETDEAFTPIEQASRTTQIVAAGVLGVVVIAAIYFSGSISRPVQALSETAKAISAGNLEAPLPTATAQDEIGDLTESFAEMTTRLSQNLLDLDRRARAVETSAEVSRRLSTILDPERLVVEVVEQVQRAFGYYHAHIYLIDEDTRDLVMAGGTGAAGREMLAAGHKIPWGRGLTGRAAESNTAVLVSDTSQAEDWLPNPLLPETKAEIAVPIAVGDRVLGVLDVQHNEVGGLDEDDQTLLESIAGQVAIALQNTRLFAEAAQTAEHEAAINLIAAQIQSATTVEDALQIAARELGKALRAKRAGIQLSHPGDDNSSLN